MLSTKSLENFARDTVISAGKLLVKMQGSQTVVKQKDLEDIATSADYASEKLIISQIEMKYPKHNIFSEEIGLINKNSDYTWVIDPLDGTKEYARGLSRYAVLLSCESQTDLITGAVYFPHSQDLFFSAKDSRRYHVSSENKLAHSFIYTHLPDKRVAKPDFSKIWQISGKITQAAYRLRTDSWDAYSLCLVAAGAADGYFLLFDGPKWWDVASGLAIAQSAGAKVTDRFGKQFKLGSLKSGLVVTNGLIHNQLLELLRY